MIARRQHSHITNKTFKVDDILNDYGAFCLPHKKGRLKWFKECFPTFLAGADPENGNTFKEFDYFNYLMAARKKLGSSKATDSAIKVMHDDLKVCKDIEVNGLKKPLDMVVMNRQYVLNRGYRRLFTLKHLGHTTVPCRVFKDKGFFDKLKPATSVEPCGLVDAVAMKQFQKESDKGTDKYWLHNYTPLYSRHLSELNPTKVLELGVKGGASLRLWSKVFPEAHIYGVDITKREEFKGFTIFEGDQADPVLLREVSAAGPYNLIVDDASHSPVKTHASFLGLWDSVASGGWYVIEDLHLNYRGDKVGRTMRKMKSLIDDMNRECNIRAMHFYYNICFIQKT